MSRYHHRDQLVEEVVVGDRKEVKKGEMSFVLLAGERGDAPSCSPRPRRLRVEGWGLLQILLQPKRKLF